MTTTQTHNVKPVVVTVRIPADLHKRLSQAAHESGESQSLFIAQAIEARIDYYRRLALIEEESKVLEAMMQLKEEYDRAK